MRFDGNYGRAKNYEPNSFDGPVQSNEPMWAPLAIHGETGTYDWDQHQSDHFEQAGRLYRLMPEDAKARLVANIGGGLAKVNDRGIVVRSIAYFRQADADYGARVVASEAEHRAAEAPAKPETIKGDTYHLA